MKKIRSESSQSDEFKEKVLECLGLHEQIHSKILKAEATCHAYNDENKEATV